MKKLTFPPGGASLAALSSLVLHLFATSAMAATTGWNQTTPGTYSYTDTANWVSSTINDTFDASLSLTDDGTTGSQILTFGTDYGTAGALSFAYTDANTISVPYNFTLVSDGSGPRALTLGGDLTFSPVRTTRLLTIGSAIAGEELAVNLGGATRTFNVVTAGGSSADPGSGVTLLNAVSNGALTKTGAGWMRLGGTEANTFTGLTTVSAGVLRLQKTAGVDAVGGDILINGGTLLLSNNNQISDTASVTLSSGAIYFAATSGTTSGNTPKSETFKDLTVTGGTLNTSPKTAGSGASATDTVSGTMDVAGGTISIRNGGLFTANQLKVTNSTVAVSTITSSSQRTTTLVIGSGGLEITNTASGAYTAISIGNWAKFSLGGGVTFTGNGSNANTTTIAAAADQAGGAADARTLSLNGGTRTFTINDGAAEVDLLLDADFTIIDGTGTGGITKAGLGTLQIASAGTYTGASTVSAGTLLVSGSLPNTSGFSVSGGTLKLGASNVLGDAATMTLSGGTLDSQTFTDTLGALTLSGNSFISLNSGGALAFADSSSATWGAFTIDITGFVSASSLRFGTSNTGLTSGQLSQFTATGVSSFGLDSNGYLTAVPEPSTCALLTLSLTTVIILRSRRQG